MESLHRQPDATRDYTAFINELRQFHQNRNTSFRHAPRINGREVDLYTLYNQVTAQGGWHKVNDGHKWDIILEAVGLPTACANANLAIRQLYMRYLAAYEKIHFLGEDPDDDGDQSAENRTRKQQLSHLQQVPMSYNYGQHELSDYQRTAVGMSQDFAYPKDYDKLWMSLMSGLPNEQDFALNIFTLLSNEGKHVLHLERMPKLVDLLIAQTGVWPESDKTLRPFFIECWKDIEGHEMNEFWESTLDTTDADVCELWLGENAAELDDGLDRELFNLKHSLGSRNAEGQRVLRVALILYNLSFESHNIPILSKNPTCLRFLLLCIYCRWSYLRQVGLDTLGNLAAQIRLSVPEDLSSRLVVRTVTEGLESTDRFMILRSLEILAHLAQFDQNDELLVCSVDLKVYHRILALLTLHDSMLIVYALEALYALSELGKRVCEKIMRVHRAVGTLVSLLTIDPQLSNPGENNYKLVETFETITTTMTTTTTTVIPNQPPPTPPQPAPSLLPPPPPPPATTATTTPQHQQHPPTPTLQVKQHQHQQQPLSQTPSAPTFSMASAVHTPINTTPTVAVVNTKQQVQHQRQDTPTICGPTEIPLKRTAATPQIHGPEMDSESVACSWLKSSYEVLQCHSIARNELYADYVAYCSRVGRKCVVNANVFSSCVRTVFPQSGLKRMESANGNVTLQHDLLKRRDFPIPPDLVTYQVRPTASSSSPLQVTCGGPGPPTSRTLQSRTQDASAAIPHPPSSHSPILKAHLSSPLRSLTPPLTATGVSPSPPSSPGPTSAGNTNLIKSLLASKVSRNIQKQQQIGKKQGETTTNCIATSTDGAMLMMETHHHGNGNPDLTAATSCRVLTATPKTGKGAKCKANPKGRPPKIVTAPIRINGMQREIQMEVDEVKVSPLNHHTASVIQNHITNNEESNSSESLDKDLLSSVLASNKANNQNGLPSTTPLTIKTETPPTQFLIPLPNTVTTEGSTGEVVLHQQQTTIPRVIVISNSNSNMHSNAELQAGNTLLVPSPFPNQEMLKIEPGMNAMHEGKDNSSPNQLLKTVLASIASAENDDEVKRRIQEKDRLYKTSPLLNGLLDKGKIPFPNEVEMGLSGNNKTEEEDVKNGTTNTGALEEPPQAPLVVKQEHKPLVVKEDILSTAMAFAELDDEPLDRLSPDPSVMGAQNISIDQMGNPTLDGGAGGECIGNIIDSSGNILGGIATNQTALIARGVTDLSSISDIARTLECASKAISRTNAECQLPFMAVTNASATNPMPTHIVSVVRINPQATAITLPMMTSAGGGMGQQIVQAHILRLPAPGMSLKMDNNQELIRLPQLTAGQLAQLQLQAGGENATAMLGGTIITSGGNASLALKRPSTNVGTPTTCYVLETKRPRQDLVGTQATLVSGIGTKTPLLEASLRQSGLTVIAAPQNSTSTTTQVVTVPAVMTADGQVKQPAQTFHLQMPKLQPKQESNFGIVTSSAGGSTIRTVIVTSSGAVSTNSLMAGGSLPTVTFVRHPNLQQTVQTVNVTSAIKCTTTATVSASINNSNAATTTVGGISKIQNAAGVAGVASAGAATANTIRPIAIPVRSIVSKGTATNNANKGGVKVDAKAKDIKAKDVKAGVTPTPPPKLKYLCQWKNCMRAFTTAPAVLFHVAKAHTPAEVDMEAVCEWENCDTMKRKKLSLLTHLQDRHCNEQLLQLQAIRRHQVAQFGKSSIPPNQPPPPHPGYAPDAALLAIRRHALQYLNPLEFQEEKEGPLTRSIRLTASLILRNLAVFCPSACSHLRQHESELSCLAMSTVESSRTIAHCLLELARPTSTTEPVVTSFVPGLKDI